MTEYDMQQLANFLRLPAVAMASAVYDDDRVKDAGNGVFFTREPNDDPQEMPGVYSILRGAVKGRMTGYRVRVHIRCDSRGYDGVVFV